MIALAIGTLRVVVHANGASMIIELAHTQVVNVQGDYKFIDSQDGGYDFLQYNPSKIGDSITFLVPLREAGNYRLQTTTYKDGVEGIYSIEVNGQELSRKDFYLSNVWEIGRVDVLPGVYQVTYRCVGKNPKSTGIGVKLGNLHFR